MRSLKVQGKGHVSVEPDMVTLSFNVEVMEIDYEDCLRNLNERAEGSQREHDVICVGHCTTEDEQFQCTR